MYILFIVQIVHTGSAEYKYQLAGRCYCWEMQ